MTVLGGVLLFGFLVWGGVLAWQDVRGMEGS
jgi:hypothetical protein